MLQVNVSVSSGVKTRGSERAIVKMLDVASECE